MKYQDAKAKIFCYASIPNGYFGDKITVGIALLGTKIYEIHKNGCHWSGAVALTTPEVTWLIKNHPRFKKWTLIKGDTA